MSEIELLRITDAAQIAGVCRTTAYSLINSKQWPVVRIGTAVRVPRKELYAWIAAQVESQNPDIPLPSRSDGRS